MITLVDQAMTVDIAVHHMTVVHLTTVDLLVHPAVVRTTIHLVQDHKVAITILQAQDHKVAATILQVQELVVLIIAQLVNYKCPLRRAFIFSEEITLKVKFILGLIEMKSIIWR